MPRFENEVISLDLPSGWLDTSDKDGQSFACPSTNEELVASFGSFQKRLDEAELAGIVWRLVEHRAAALGQMSEGGFTVLETAQPGPGMPGTGEFCGFDRKNSTFCAFRIHGQPSGFIGLSYYLRGCNEPSAGVALQASSILATCREKAKH